MTQLERLDLLSKEVLSIKDIEALFECSYDKAAGIIRAIKSTHDRLGISGTVHLQDYIQHFNLPIDRYVITVVAERDKDNKLRFYRRADEPGATVPAK